MLNIIDNFLNKITMYRLVLYYLIGLFVVASFFGFFGILPYSPLALCYSVVVLIVVSWLANWIFSSVFEAPTNVESVYITAFILTLIITPVAPSDIHALPFLIWVAVLAVASKFIIAIGKKHIFNPAAFAVALSAFTLGQSASWWVGGNVPMLIFVLFGGLLVVRKMRRTDLVLCFFVSALLSVALSVLPKGDPLVSIKMALLHAPIFFFAFVMLTEPLTTPPTRLLRFAYGVIVGLLFAPNIHLGSVYSTPELALLVGNVFAYLASPKEKYLLRFCEVVKIATDTYDYVFRSDRPAHFRPGQYLELTVGHPHPDSRGNRRYFTIASSPTESDIRFGAKFHPEGSSFKHALAALSPGDTIMAGQLSGDFTLPKNSKQKLVFVAGGIGVTPFRSMVKFLLDTNDRRTITLFYANKTVDQIAYKDVFDQAERALGMKTVYTLDDTANVPRGWNGRSGFITAAMIAEEVPDYRERIFYLSGPHGMVSAFEKTLGGMGVPWRNIKTDFFPGYA